MKSAIKSRILKSWQNRDAETVYPPASIQRIEVFEQEIGPIPEDYRWFLNNCGSGLVDSEWLDSIEELANTHRRFKSEAAVFNDPTLTNGFIIGRDSSGSPIVIGQNGRILMQWEADSIVYCLANSLEEWLLKDLINRGHPSR